MRVDLYWLGFAAALAVGPFCESLSFAVMAVVALLAVVSIVRTAPTQGGE